MFVVVPSEHFKGKLPFDLPLVLYFRTRPLCPITISNQIPAHTPIVHVFPYFNSRCGPARYHIGPWWEEYYQYLFATEVTIVAVRRDDTSSVWHQSFFDTYNVAIMWHNPNATCDTQKKQPEHYHSNTPQTDVHVAMTIVNRPVPNGPNSREMEGIVALMSLAYYRTCPVTLHIVASTSDQLSFRDVERRHFSVNSPQEPQWWYKSDMAVNGRNRQINSNPIIPPPMYFRYSNLDDHPLSAYVFNLSVNETVVRQVDGMLKLVPERLLPDDVERVIMLDFDTMVVRDICEMWREVWSEVETQANENNVVPFFGFTPEMGPYYDHPIGHVLSFQTDEWNLAPGIYYGINSGVIIADLKAARSEGWSMMWMRQVLAFVRAYPHLDPWYLSLTHKRKLSI